MAQLMTIPEALAMVQGLNSADEFEFRVSSVDYRCETLLVRALRPIFELTGGRGSIVKGCSTCVAHAMNPVSHLVRGKKT